MNPAGASALEYISTTFAPIAVPYKSKNPGRDDWQNERLTVDDIPQYFNGHAQNVGLLLGEPSRGLVDGDLDCPQARTLADAFLPATRAVFGRPGAPRSHRLYIADPLVQTKQYIEPGTHKKVLELRSTGAQTVVPRSTHESGEPITWVRGTGKAADFASGGELAPLAIDGRELRICFDRLAAAVLLARSWPGAGSRHDAAKHLSGGLSRAGWGAEDVKAFIEAVARAGGDDEVADRVGNAATSQRRIVEGKTVTGWPSLAELIGDDVVGKVIEWLGIAPHEAGDSASAKGRQPSQATQLVQLALDAGCELFYTPDGEAYAHVPINGHTETRPLRSKAVRGWLCRLFYQQAKTTPGAQALQDSLGVLEGRALYDGPEHPVYVRVARHDGAIWLDLANDAWQRVRITAAGWEITDNPQVRFRRSNGMLALPTPERGGAVSELWPFLNVVGEGERALLAGFLVGALKPEGPYPVLALSAEQGSGKTTAARMIRSLIDPSTVPLRAEPRNSHDLMIAAHNGWLLSFDNLSYLPQWLSNAFCRFSTGGGNATRQLYTDNEEILFDAQRPIVISSIEDVVTRPDLLDRTIILPLLQIDAHSRLPESRLWAQFDRARGRILGGLLDAVSTAMQDQPSIELDELPRMADFALWATAAEPGLGVKSGAFMAAYSGNRADAHSLALDAEPVAATLIAFMEGQESGEWTGKASALLEALNSQAGYVEKKHLPEGWPKKPDKLSGLLKRLAPNLRYAGWDVLFPPRTGKAGRTITIRKVPQRGDTSDTAVALTPENSINGDATCGTGDANSGASVASDAKVHEYSNGSAPALIRCPIKPETICQDCTAESRCTYSRLYDKYGPGVKDG
jgi:hypothetical protein